MRQPCSLCVFPLTILNLYTDFNKNWHERYATGGHLNRVLLNFLQSVITTWWRREIVRWERTPALFTFFILMSKTNMAAVPIYFIFQVVRDN
jgi:hypothetical protein